MKAINKSVLAVMILWNFSFWSSKGTGEAGNHEAIILHNSMIRKVNEIEHRLNEIKSDSTVSTDSIITLSQALNQWKRDVVAVPGNDEHDDHSRNHTHNHAKEVEVTEEQMLQIQRELDRRLSEIGKRSERLKPIDNAGEHIH